MKNIISSFFTILISVLSFSQTENQIVESAVSSLALEREIVTVNNLYLQGQFISMIQKGSTEEILNVSHEKDFKGFTKRTYVDGKWVSTLLAEEDSTFVSILEEIQMGLPKGIKTSPTDTEMETLIDDFVTDYWKYTNKQGKVCEVRVYFLNGQLRNLGYWIYE
jgi:hypothetical protein